MNANSTGPAALCRYRDACSCCDAPCEICAMLPRERCAWVGVSWCSTCMALTHHHGNEHVPSNLSTATNTASQPPGEGSKTGDYAAQTLRLAKECLLTPFGTPWPVSATTIFQHIDAAVAMLEDEADGKSSLEAGESRG